MRALGLIGIALLLPVMALALWDGAHRGDWQGVGWAVIVTVMLVVFAKALWAGRSASSGLNSADPAATGWYGQPVARFVSNLLLRSPEGWLLLGGIVAALVLAGLVLTVPVAVGVPEARASGAATFLCLWPILAFVLYVRICSPEFRTSVYTVMAMVALVCAPWFVVYR